MNNCITIMAKLISLFVFLLFSLNLSAQSDPQLNTEVRVEVVTKTGDRFSGFLVSQDETRLVLLTGFGKISIDKKDIHKLDYVDQNKTGLYRNLTSSSEHSGSHYLFGQSGFGLKKGQAYYENVYLFLNSYTVGLTDNFSLSAGIELFSLFAGEPPGLFLTPKVHFPFNGGAFSLSPSFIYVDGSTVGLIQSAVTLGNLDKNFTIGVGYGLSFGSESFGSNDSIVAISFSGVTRVSERISLISENVLLLEQGIDALFSLGIRVHSKFKNSFLTISLFRPTDGDLGPVPALPFFSGTVAIN